MTQTILEIQASARVDGSITRRLTQEYIAKSIGANVITRDLNNGIPLLNAAWIDANTTPVGDRNDAQKQVLAGSDELIHEIKQADTLLIGAPVYNFAVPGALKAWIDQVCRVGVTFQYTENGPVDLLTGKRAIVVMASGGMPIGSAADYASRYIRHVLGFIGISDLTIISADALGQDAADKVATASVEINKAA